MAESIDIRELNERIERQSAFVTNLTTGMDQIIVGQKHLVESLLIGLLSDGHVLLEGVPGLAKTLAIKTLASLIDAKYSRIQFTPDLMPSDVLGTTVFNMKTNDFDFHQGPIFADIVLVDEINRSPAKTQAALFEVMEERQITNDGVEYAMEFPFMVVATQNPVEHEGTYRLPEAQLDRFMFKILVDYPRKEEEIEVSHNNQYEYISRGFRNKHAALDDEKVTQIRCYKCSKKVKTHIDWFANSPSSYMCVGKCWMHGYFCGKIKFKSVNNNYYVHKTIKPIDKQGIEAIKQKQEDIREKRKEKRHMKSSN